MPPQKPKWGKFKIALFAATMIFLMFGLPIVLIYLVFLVFGVNVEH